jgi:hypothetical protein
MAFELFIAVLKDDEAVDDILTAFLEIGVGGATVVPGRGMAEIVSEQLPLFAGFRDVFRAGGTSRLVLAAVPLPLLEATFEAFRRVAHTTEGPGGGVAFSLPIARESGLTRQETEELED